MDILQGWNDINDVIPGPSLQTYNILIVRFSDKSYKIMKKIDAFGKYHADDGNTEIKITHWRSIQKIIGD